MRGLAGIVGFGVDMKGLASLMPGYEGPNKVEITRAQAFEASKRMSNPLRHLDFLSSVRQPGN